MHYELLLAATLLITGQATVPAPDSAAAEETLELRYARSKLELARANLARVEQMNRRLDRSVPSSVVAEFKHKVSAAELQFEQAARDEGSDFVVWLRRAENSYRSANNRWQTARAANERVNDTIPTLDVERFRLRAKVARLQWDRGKQLVGASPERQRAWQVDLLNDELELVKEETSRVAPFVRYYPIWFY